MAFILEGSVRKSGDRIRVTAQLIDTRSDCHLWSENYDRTLADVFAVQDEIGGAIGKALEVELRKAGGREVASETLDPELYEQFLLARFLLQRNDAAIASAIEQLALIPGSSGDSILNSNNLTQNETISGSSAEFVGAQRRHFLSPSRQERQGVSGCLQVFRKPIGGAGNSMLYGSAPQCQ